MTGPIARNPLPDEPEWRDRWQDALCADHPKRPRVGDTVEINTGPAVVQSVHAHGQRLVVRDRLDREWTVERAAAGCWLRTARCPS